MVVNVADDDGQQTEQEDDSCGIEDWVERLNAGREILHPSKILWDTHIKMFQSHHFRQCVIQKQINPEEKV